MVQPPGSARVLKPGVYILLVFTAAGSSGHFLKILFIMRQILIAAAAYLPKLLGKKKGRKEYKHMHS